MAPAPAAQSEAQEAQGADTSKGGTSKGESLRTTPRLSATAKVLQLISKPPTPAECLARSKEDEERGRAAASERAPEEPDADAHAGAPGRSQPLLRRLSFGRKASFGVKGRKKDDAESTSPRGNESLYRRLTSLAVGDSSKHRATPPMKAKGRTTDEEYPPMSC